MVLTKLGIVANNKYSVNNINDGDNIMNVTIIPITKGNMVRIFSALLERS